MIRGLAVVLCAAGAAVLLVLAVQAHRWERTLRADDVRFGVEPLAPKLWNGPGGAGAGEAGRLLGVRDDVEFRIAEQEFARVHVTARTYADETRRLTAFGRAQSTLESIARGDSAPERRARAANLLGVLLWEDASTAPDNAPLLQRQALESFRRAVRIDPGEADAKWNLELLSTALQSNLERRNDSPSQAGGTGSRGAGGATAGRGY